MIKAITAVFLLGLGVSFFLSLTNYYTQDKIAKNKILHQSQILRKLLMDHQIEIPEPADPTASDCSNWIIRKIESPGYSGNIESLGLVQFRKEGAVLSLRIINHSETPGIGDFIDHRKNSWIKKLDNKNIGTGYLHSKNSSNSLACSAGLLSLGLHCESGRIHCF